MDTPMKTCTRSSRSSLHRAACMHVYSPILLMPTMLVQTICHDSSNPMVEWRNKGHRACCMHNLRCPGQRQYHTVSFMCCCTSCVCGEVSGYIPVCPTCATLWLCPVNHFQINYNVQDRESIKLCTHSKVFRWDMLHTTPHCMYIPLSIVKLRHFSKYHEQWNRLP